MSFFNRRRIIFITVLILLITRVAGFWVQFGYENIYNIIWLICGITAIVIELVLWRCPHCDSYLFHTTWWHDYCPNCGEYLYEEKTWCSDFEKLNYMQGDLRVFEDRAETMFLVTYEDGMYIHVGYDAEECEFVVTALANDSDEAKASPLALYRVFGHSELLKVLQKTVHDIRDDKI